MNDNTAEVYADDARPNVRVRLVYDLDPSMPYGDALAPVVDIPDRGSVDYLSEYKPSSVDATWVGGAARHFGNDWELVGRWLRMFCGATTVDYITHRYRTLILFDTPDWRKHVGIEDGSPVTLDTPEWQAWLDGEVFGVIVETRATTATVVRDSVTGEVIREEAGEVWEHEDACYGYYGRKYAEQEARAQLAQFIKDTASA